MSLFFDEDTDPSLVLSKTVAVVGHGNQGQAQAANLLDRGVRVVVGTRAVNKTVPDGLDVRPIPDAVAEADWVVMTVPDEVMGEVFEASVAPAVKPGAVLVFAHGFAVTYRQVEPPYGAVLVSPSGPGTAVRGKFLAGSGVPGFVAATSPELEPVAMSYAWALGMGRVGIIKTTFEEETVCDLFGEQVVLCGGMPELAVAAFETLVDAGFTPEVAYTECVQQLRLLADLVSELGVAGMRQRISDTAEWGSYQAGPRIVDGHVREEMRKILAGIVSGKFAEEWLTEASRGKTRMKALRDEQRSRLHEQTFRGLSARGKAQ